MSFIDHQTQLFFSLFSYLIILVLIAYLSYHKQKKASDFILGERSLNFYVTALSAHASDMSSWLFMAFPASIYLGGTSQIWAAIGLVFFMYCNWRWIAPKIRLSTEGYDSLTLPSYFEKHFSDPLPVIRLSCSILLLVFLTIYIASGLVGIGLLFESLFSLNYSWGVFLGTLVILTYTLIGGYVTVAWTDLFQALFLLFAILITPLLVATQKDFPSLKAFFDQENFNLSLSTSLSSLLTVCGWGLGYFGQPHILNKFMGIKDARELKKSRYVGIFWQCLALLGSCLVGVCARSYFKHPISNPELIFVEMVKGLFSPYFSGLILCGVIAATLSTIDSMLLVSAATIGEDFFKPLEWNPQKELLVTRLSTLLIASIAFFIAFNRLSSIYNLVFYSWAGLGCTFGPLVILSLYAKKPPFQAAYACLFFGGFCALFWPRIDGLLPFPSIPTMIPGYLLSFLGFYLVCFLKKRS